MDPYNPHDPEALAGLVAIQLGAPITLDTLVWCHTNYAQRWLTLREYFTTPASMQPTAALLGAQHYERLFDACYRDGGLLGSVGPSV